MVEIFGDIGSVIDNYFNWLTENTLCKLFGHKWAFLHGSYPLNAYCSRCERAYRILTIDEIDRFNFLLRSGGVDMNEFDKYLRRNKYGKRKS